MKNLQKFEISLNHDHKSLACLQKHTNFLKSEEIFSDLATLSVPEKKYSKSPEVKLNQIHPLINPYRKYESGVKEELAVGKIVFFKFFLKITEKKRFMFILDEHS